MDIVDRIFAIVDAKFKEQREFAISLHVAPARVSEWRKRKSQSYTKYLSQIADILGTTVQYLLTGEEGQNKQTAVPKDSGLDEEFARIFMTLTPEKQNKIIAEMLRLQRGE